MELPPSRPLDWGVHHGINTGDVPPKNIAVYPLSTAKLEELKQQLETLFKLGLIRTSSSLWGFPVVFAPKSDGTLCMCINYQALNKVTKQNSYPLPRIQELLDIVGQAQYLLKLNLLTGYWQIPLNELLIPKTAFNTIFGKFEWIAMPFSLSNAPATF